MVRRRLSHLLSRLELEGEIGVLERKHIIADGIIYIGKEASNIENTGILSRPEYSIYMNQEELKERILNMTWKEAREKGLNEETLRRMKIRLKRMGIK
ncbi:MAG: hypothetical protein NTY20_06100 [Candidatus Aenigmarchaeota archaeon]|nr:hypothetical protein [Candidatus Aenigmarchaeota archaeon]